MKTLYAFGLFLALYLSACQSPAPSPETPKEIGPVNKAFQHFPAIEVTPTHEVLTLGVFHFDRSRDGSDVVAKNHIDINTESNQQQLREILSKLEAFRPSRIAVEWRPDVQPVLDSLYQAYLEGSYELGKNEAFQIGFPLAKALGHERVYCIDNNPPFPDNINAIDDWYAYADSIGHIGLWEAYDAENNRYNTFMDTIQRHLSLLEYLHILNSKQNLVRSKQLWTTGIVNVGHGDAYLGADLLGRWYRRNSRLFANAKNLMEDGDQNLLIIYGGAHKWILDELFESAPEFEVVQFNDLMRFDEAP